MRVRRTRIRRPRRHRPADAVRLSRSLGHTQITTTMHYLQLLTEDLSREHVKVSLLSRGPLAR